MLTNVFILTGTIIGAGIFSLPFILQKTGLLFFIQLIILSLTSIFLSFAYLEIIKKVKKTDQLPFYIEKFLGKKMGFFSKVLFIFSLIGALTGYLMLIKYTIDNIIFFIIPIWLIFLFKKDLIEKIDDGLTFILLGLLFALIYINIKPINLSIKPSIKNIVDSFGIILFSLTGFSVIPELDLRKNPKMSILLSYLIVTLIYALFAMTKTNNHKLFFNSSIIFAITTSYIPLTSVLEQTLIKDFSFSTSLGKITSLLTPLIFLLIGGKNFLNAFSLTGGVFIALLQILIIFSFLKTEKKFPIRIIAFFTIALLLIGVLSEILKNLYL